MQKWIQNEQNGTQMSPKWFPNPSPRPPKGPGGLEMAQEVRRWSQWGSKSSPRIPKMVQEVVHMAPNMTPRGAKMAPKGPKDQRWPLEASKGAKLVPKMGYGTFKKHVFFLCFLAKMTYWGLKMATFLDPCDINDMSWCESKLANMMHHKRTWCALKGLQGAPRVPKRPTSIPLTKVSGVPPHSPNHLLAVIDVCNKFTYEYLVLYIWGLMQNHTRLEPKGSANLHVIYTCTCVCLSLWLGSWQWQ